MARWDSSKLRSVTVIESSAAGPAPVDALLPVDAASPGEPGFFDADLAPDAAITPITHTLEFLEFDTAVLQLPISRLRTANVRLTPVELDSEMAKAHKLGIRLVYFAACTEAPWVPEILAKCARDGHHVSHKVFYLGDVDVALATETQHPGSTQIAVKPCPGHPSPAIEAQLLELAVLSGGLSRFASDPKLGPSKYRAMYETWMRNSINRLVADEILIARRNGDAAEVIAGFLSVKVKAGVLNIELMAVDPGHRRMGVAKSLLLGAFRWARGRGVTRWKVATQADNAGARRLYEKLGSVCRTSDDVVDVHFWTDPSHHGTSSMSMASSEVTCSGSATPDTTPKLKLTRNTATAARIPNSRPCIGGAASSNLAMLLQSQHIQTHGKYATACQDRLERELVAKKVLLVNSGTGALEICALCIGAEDGVEVIMPSYTFTSTANAFVTHGATPVFVDVRADTQNIDETKIEAAITPRTRAICCVHYGGIACEMDAIMAIARRHSLLVVEDNAHGIHGSYKGQMLGTIGDVAAVSFHYTKNVTCGEGGAVIINNPVLLQTGLVAWEKGTDRHSFMLGHVDKYTWVGKGGSYVLSELCSAVLASQLEMRPMMNAVRHYVWNTYHAELKALEVLGRLTRPTVPEGCIHNGHNYYVRITSPHDFARVLKMAGEQKVGIVTHYVPLHSTPAGRQYGRVGAVDAVGAGASQENQDACAESSRCAASLVRLPMYVGLSESELETVLAVVYTAMGMRRGAVHMVSRL